MKTSASGFLMAVLVTAAALTSTQAQITPLLSYQGHVKVSGTDYTGNGQFKFSLIRMDAVAGRRATAVADQVPGGFLVHIQVTDSGSGYTTPPAVTITDVSGSGAVAVAAVSGGGVTGITVQNAGSGYSQNPTITVAPPPNGEIASTLWSNDGTGTGGAEPTNALSIPVSAGVFAIHLGDSSIATMASLPAIIFTNQPMYLRVWFNDGTNGFQQLSPDTLLPTSGFAMVAATLADGVPSSIPPDGSITTAKLSDGAVTQAKLATGSVGLNQLADGAIGTSKLADGSVVGAKLATGAVASANLTANAVTTSAITDASVTNPKIANSAVNSSKIANGNVVRSLNGLTEQVTLSAGAGINLSQTAGTLTITASNTVSGWGLTGNSGTTAGTDYVGTTDSQPLELRVKGQRALRLEPTTQTGVVNVLGGSPSNTISSASGAVIAGGGTTTSVNAVAGDFSTVSGGQANSISSANAVVSGGAHNVIGTSADFSIIGGGNSNAVNQSAANASIMGGSNNTIGNGANGAAIFGGTQNQIGSNAQFALSLGGFSNVISNNALYGVVLGGSNNRAASPNSLAAGRNAQAQNIGSFVWADSNDGNFTSTNANQFSVRATGGVRFVSGIDGTGVPNAGVSLAPGDTSWSVISDRSVKKNIKSVNSRAILERLAGVPILEWNYQWEPDRSTPHLGPMAQDFKSAFFPGRDQRTISTLEFDGVALAAIQGLNRKLEDSLAAKDRRLDELATANAELRRRLDALEKSQHGNSRDSKD